MRIGNSRAEPVSAGERERKKKLNVSRVGAGGGGRGASHAQFRPERRCRQPGALMDSGQSAEQRQEEAESRGDVSIGGREVASGSFHRRSRCSRIRAPQPARAVV